MPQTEVCSSYVGYKIANDACVVVISNSSSNNSARENSLCYIIPDLKHLLDFPTRQVDVQLVEELVDLVDVQESVSVLVGLLESLLQPRPTR